MAANVREILPWDHILSGPSKTYLQNQYDDLLAKLHQTRGEQ